MDLKKNIPEFIKTCLSEFKEPVVLIDSDCRVVFMNKTALKEFGSHPGKLSCHSLFHGSDIPCHKIRGFYCPLKIMQENNLEKYSTIHVHKNKNGENYYLISCSLFSDQGFTALIHINVDRILDELTANGVIDEGMLREGALEKLNYLVSKDQFIRRLSERLKNHTVRYLSIMDVRGLSFINRFYGMVAGDLMIRELEKVIYEVLKKHQGEHVFSRAAGDEFIILHSAVTKEAVRRIENSILRKLSRLNLSFVDEMIRPRVSLGTLEVSTENDYQVDDVLKLLSYSKTQAKLASEKKFTLDQGMVQGKLLNTFREKKQCVLEVQNALENSNINLFFQPIIDFSSGEIYDLEALVRIEQDNYFLPANLFIDLIYELDQVLKLDLLVFEKIRSYRQDIKKICPRIFINLGPNSLKSRQFRKVLEETIFSLKMSGLELTIELTEQSLLEDADIVKHIHSRYGFRFAIDDFGTGYSSFKTVADLSNSGAVSTIKIDGSLVSGVSRSCENRSIIKAVTSLASALELKTVAEFIDNRQDLDCLKKLGVDFGQGYLFSQPVSVNDLLENHQLILSRIRKELHSVFNS